MTIEQLDKEMRTAFHGRNPSPEKSGELARRMNKWARNTYGVVPTERYSLANESESRYTASVNGILK